MESRRKFFQFDFIRAISALGVVFYHFAVESGTGFPILNFERITAWGSIFVTCFFMISGAGLYVNYSEVKDKKKFYLKRWKSIFPTFYIGYIFAYAFKSIITGSVLWGQPQRLILTFLGLDGYLSSYCDTYYLIGEWFLGAIIILYALYPFAAKLFGKYKMFTAVIPCFTYIIILLFFNERIVTFRSVSSCMLSFIIGMAIIEYKDLIDDNLNIITVFSFIFLIVLWFLPISCDKGAAAHIVGILIFFVLYYLGGKGERVKLVNVCAAWVCKYSYCIYLVHHMIISYGLIAFDYVGLENTVIRFSITVIIIAFAAVLFYYAAKYIENFVSSAAAVIARQK